MGVCSPSDTRGLLRASHPQASDVCLVEILESRVGGRAVLDVPSLAHLANPVIGILPGRVVVQEAADDPVGEQPSPGPGEVADGVQHADVRPGNGLLPPGEPGQEVHESLEKAASLGVRFAVGNEVPIRGERRDVAEGGNLRVLARPPQDEPATVVREPDHGEVPLRGGLGMIGDLSAVTFEELPRDAPFPLRIPMPLSRSAYRRRKDRSKTGETFSTTMPLGFIRERG